MFIRDDLLTDLRTSVIEVTFRKVSDGNIRIMRCTLREDLLPRNYNEVREDENKYHNNNKDNIIAWDLNINAWRSFRMDTVINLEDVDEKYPRDIKYDLKNEFQKDFEKSIK